MTSAFVNGPAGPGARPGSSASRRCTVLRPAPPQYLRIRRRRTRTWALIEDPSTETVVPFQTEGYKVPFSVIAAAQEAADAAGVVARKYFRATELAVESKSDESPVTIADREAEAVMRSILQRRFPEWPVLGEEGGSTGNGDSDGATSEFMWVLDPIDGTKAFVTGKPTFGTLIALARNGKPVLGIIDQPITRERWIGASGHATRLNKEPVGVRRGPFGDQNVLSSVYLNATTPDMFLGTDKEAFDRLARECKLTLFGSDCYAYALLATGTLDLVVEADLKPWDFMALIPVVRGAGGTMTDWKGADLDIESDGRVVAASNASVHGEVIRVLEQGKSDDAVGVDRGYGFVESMTGYGRAEANSEQTSCTVELRSVNSRFCEVNSRMPRSLVVHEEKLVGLVKRRIARGKILMSVELSEKEGPTIPIAVDPEAVKAARRLLEEVKLYGELDDEVRIQDIVQFSEVFVKRPPALEEDEIVLQIVEKTLNDAISDLQRMRRREGYNLEIDIFKRLEAIHSRLLRIRETASGLADIRRKQLRERVKRLTDIPGEIDPSRLEVEIALYADQVDITEEIVRLQSHLNLFRKTFCDVTGPIGTKLKFLIHEMQREANTIAQKGSNADIAETSTGIKEELERIREQLQNIS